MAGNIMLARWPDWQERLTALGEWAALGFYEGSELPWPRAYGLAYRRLYEKTAIRLRDGALLAPSEPFRIEPGHERLPGDKSWFWDSGEEHHATGFICDFMHSCGLHVNDNIAASRKISSPAQAAFIDDLVTDLKARLVHFGGYTHTNPDIRCVVGEGFDAMERELDLQIAAVAAQGDSAIAEEKNLLASLKDYAIGVRTFHARVTGALRKAVDRAQGSHKAELAVMADAFADGFLSPCRTFVQGLQAVHFTWMLDGCDSIGRVDQALGPLFDRDRSTGELTQDLARRLLDEFLADFERLNGWNMQVGGYRPDGVDGCNSLTREIILACGRNRFRRPNVAFRITRHTPVEVVRSAMEVLSAGSGRPALYNDDLYVPTLRSMDLGLTDEDAREIGFGGCTETMIAGMSNVGSLEGDLNLAKTLELALYDGRDSLSGEQVGPRTGRLEDFPDFESFLGAVRRQIQYMTDSFVVHSREALQRRFTAGDPKLYRTLFTRDCVKRRRSFEAGGARYNWAVVSYSGIANLADGLAAVRRCVFDDLSVKADELSAALRADFEGHQQTLRALQAAPKFGNDDPYVDELAARMLEFAWRELLSYETPRGGRYIPSCILFTTYGQAGAGVGALPDGRGARTPLADSVGPHPGRDVRGPTAMLKSVARLPLALGIGTPVLNIRFPKQFLLDPAGLEGCKNLVGTFFKMGGAQIQVSVLDTQEMRAAQREPQKHGDLIVRIGGYSEYFTKLDASLQESVIARTEHG